MKFYLKMAILPFLYIFFSAMLGLGIILIDQNLVFLQYALCCVNLAFYVLVVGIAGNKDGQKAIKVRNQNDQFRRVIIETGEDLPLNLHEEYKPWKGFVIGLIACIPSVLLIIIHVILNLTNPVPNYGFGVAGGVLSIVVFSFFMVSTVAKSWTYYLFVLLIIPFVTCTYGGFYVMGASKAQKQYDKINQIQQTIHGDKV